MKRAYNTTPRSWPEVDEKNVPRTRHYDKLGRELPDVQRCETDRAILIDQVCPECGKPADPAVQS